MFQQFRGCPNIFFNLKLRCSIGSLALEITIFRCLRVALPKIVDLKASEIIISSYFPIELNRMTRVVFCQTSKQRTMTQRQWCKSSPHSHCCNFPLRVLTTFHSKARTCGGRIPIALVCWLRTLALQHRGLPGYIVMVKRYPHWCVLDIILYQVAN